MLNISCAALFKHKRFRVANKAQRFKLTSFGNCLTAMLNEKTRASHAHQLQV